MAGARIQLKRATAAQWTAANPVLYAGEIGLETDTNKFKIGNGSTAFNSLTYFNGNLTGSSLNDLSDVTIVAAANGDFLRWNGTAWINDAVNLSTDTVGSYVESLVAGTGITLTNNSGEAATPTIAVTANTYDAYGAASSAASGAASALSSHESDTTNIHGIADTSILVTTTGSQTLTNKTITSPSGLVKGDVGLGNVDDTSDANKPISTATQSALDLKAPLASPTFTGTVTLPDNTVALGTKTTGDYVASLVAGTGVTLTNNSGETATPTIAIGQAVATNSNVTFNDLTVSGNLTVSGTTTSVNTETINLADNIITLNSNATGAPTENAGIEVERGSSDNVSIRWNETSDSWEITEDGTNYKNVAVGQDVETTSSVTFASVTAPLTGNASTATTLETSRTIELTGDVTGSASFNGSANASIAATIAANSVALGSDTTGDYVASLVAGTGITLTNNSGETATPTIAVTANTYDAYGAASSAASGAASALSSHESDTTNIHGIADTSLLVTTTGTQTLTNKTITSPSGLVKGDVGLGNVDDTSDANKPVSSATQSALDLKAPLASPTFTGTVTLPDNTVALGTKTTGDYVASLVAGTGITLTNNSGESATPTVAVTTNTYDAYGAASTAASNAATALSNHESDTTNIHGIADTSILVTTTGSQTLTNKTITSPSGLVKGDVGLGNVDDTSDANKPISTATQSALDLKAPLASPTFTGTVTLPNNTVELGTKTTGDYVASLVAGTGVTITNNSGETATPTISIGQAVATNSNVTFNDVVVSGDLTVSGTTTTVNTETINLADNTITLNSNATGAPTENAGLEIERGSGANVQIRWNETSDKWELTADGSTYADIATEDYAESLTPSSLDDIGDVTITSASNGQFLKWNGSAWVNDAIDLGTDTTGNYMSGVTAGTGISVTHTPGEGSTATVSLNATLDDLSNVSASSPSDGQFLKYVTASSAWVPAAIPTINNLDDVGDVTITSAANGQFLKWNGTAWVNDSIPTINTLDDVGDVTITSAASGDFLKWNGTAWVNDPINLSTDTVGDYVSSLVAGTGVTLTNNSGEGATPTVAIGQAVGTSDSPTFAGGIFTGSSSATLVRITQTGSGNAFVVEDETNPDSTPLVVDATGRVYVGKTTNHQYASQVGSATGTEQSKLQVTQGNITVENSSGLTTNTDSNRGGAIVLSRGSSSTNTVGGPIGNTEEGMYLGHVVFAGSRSNNSSKGAQINSRAEAFATDTGVPAYLSIDTVNTSGTLGERMRVSANGLVGINVSPSAQLHVVNSTAANDALIVRAASSQTGDLTDWQNSSGTTLAKIASDGSAQVAGIELGHATDTTITRVSAGKIAVEGVTVATTTDTRDVLVRFYMEVI